MTQFASTQSAPAPHQAQPDRKARLKRILPVLIPLVLLVVATGVGLRYWWSRPDDSTVELSGRIEGYETDLGAKVGGRVAAIAVREGSVVRQGQVIARLDDAEVRAQLQAAGARVTAAQQQVTQARLQLDVLASQVVEAELALQQSQGDTAGQVRQSQAAVAAAAAQLTEARAQVQQAESALALARADRERFASLLAQGAIPQQQFDQIQTTFETARDTLAARQAAVAAAQQQVSAAQGVLTQAQTSQLNPDIRRAQVERLRKQQEQAKAQLAAAEADLEQAQADYTEIEARLQDLEIKSPIDGVVVSRMVEPGEVIAAGTPVITVVDLEEVYLRGYIPEGEVGLVRVGQPAQVFLDSAPEQPLQATVSAVDTEASFTPENIYFQEDRVDQVFGLRLGIENPGGFAKPGMPADGTILLEQSGAE
ncbi:HlyD family secretion protein [Halomicronema hongdechloris]|nr:HlyD family efflux transporter periplasmic adaptor subunit [Halomicronema hongdechloris]